MAQNQSELILNVDDTDAARYAKTRILRHAGFAIIEARTGAEALQQAAEHLPSLILLDTKLPDMSGFDVCAALKSDPRTRAALVLQTSASYIAAADRIRGLNSGADNYLFEPIEPEELIANVRALLRLGRVERELRDVDRRKDEFLAILAHELRNPLGPIRSAAEFLGRLPSPLPEKHEAARQTILRQTTHMVRLIDDLLDVSRISQGKIALHRSIVQLQEVVNSAVETATSNIQQRHHTLQVEMPGAPIWLNADSIRLSQALANLLNNAAKFTPPGGAIGLTVERAGDRVTVRIRDSGIGIAAEHLGSIFNLFAQGGHAADRVQDGLGIGLSLVRTLVALHEGSVGVFSDGVGLGSVFEVTLPIAAGDGDGALFAAALKPEAGATRILVVDDNLDSATMLGALLEMMGHEVFIANDGATAIRKSVELVPDIVFLDIGLPDMSGFDAAAAIRNQAALASVRLVALTGYGGQTERANANAHGFDRFLTKPVSIDELNGTITALATDAGPAR